MDPLKTTAWCCFWAGGVIGTFFFKTDKGTAVTVHAEPYRDVISTQLWPNLEESEIDSLWFQHDGATCHTSRKTLCSPLINFKEKRSNYFICPETTPHSRFQWMHFTFLHYLRVFISPNPAILFVDNFSQVKVNLTTANNSFCKIITHCKSFQNSVSKSP